MNKKFVFSAITISLIISNNGILVYGHGAGSYMTSRDLRIEDETFSSSNITTLNGTITISGKLVSLSDYEIKSPLTILVSSDQKYDPITKGIHDLTFGQFNDKPRHASVGAYEHLTNWYFTVESYPSEISLKPEEVLDYKIIIRPLKAGIYHVHTLLPSTTQYIGSGSTIQVEGTDQITNGEFWGLYFASTLILVASVGSFGIITYFILKSKTNFVENKK